MVRIVHLPVPSFEMYLIFDCYSIWDEIEKKKKLWEYKSISLLKTCKLR